MKHSAKFITFLFGLFIITSTVVAQSSESDKLLLKEIDDFISLAQVQSKEERELSNEIRTSMLKLINELQYDELLFGITQIIILYIEI